MRANKMKEKRLEHTDMFILRLIKKALLLLVMALIQLARLACKVAIDLSSYVTGPLLLFVAGCDIFCLVEGRMQDVLILSMILVGILLFVVFAAVIEEMLLSAKNALSRSMR